VLTQHFHAREDTRVGNGVERSATEPAPKLENSFNAAKVALHNNRQTVSAVGGELLGCLLMAWALSGGWCDAAICPELGANRKCPMLARYDVIAE
jgi:hypothetical protein